MDNKILKINNSIIDDFLKGINKYDKQKKKEKTKFISLFLYTLKNLIYRSAHFCNFSNRKTINLSDLKSAIILEFYNDEYSNQLLTIIDKNEELSVNIQLKNILYSFIPNYFIIHTDIILKIFHISKIIAEKILNDNLFINKSFLKNEKFKYFFQNYNK